MTEVTGITAPGDGNSPVPLSPRSTARRLLVVALASAALAAACTSGEGPVAEGEPAPSTQRTTTTSVPADEDEPEGGPGRAQPDGEAGVTVEGTAPAAPSPDELAALSTLTGRLAVAAAARLTVTGPDGTELAVLAGEPTVIADQAVWSPDGGRLAWSRSTAEGHELVVTEIGDGAGAENGEGGGELVSPAPGPPAFYLQWSAAGDRLAYLRNDADGAGVELGVAVPAEPVVPLLSDAPLFVAWSLVRPELALHLGAFQVARLSASSTTPEVVLEPTGRFSTPAWIDDRTLVVVATEGLALLDVETGQTEVLIEAREEVLFVVSPDRRRIAYHLPELTDEGVSLVAGAQAGGPEARVAGLAVLDIDTGQSIQVSPTVPLSFEWSPDGRSLAWLSNDFDGGAGWSFWDGADITVAEPYRVSDRDRLTVLPFFEQYAQSHSRWSPDGRAFAFAGIVAGRPEGEASGIWVHLVGSDLRSIRIATGDLVSWGG